MSYGRRLGIFVAATLLGLAAVPTNLHARRIGRPAYSSSQQPANAGAAAPQKADDIRELQPGEPVELDLAGGEAHSYQLAVGSGHYVRVVVDQRGIDIALTVFGPEGKQLVEVNLTEAGESELVSLIAEAATRYVLKVRSAEKNATKGRYEIKIEEVRAATEQDKRRVLAETAVAEAMLLHSQQTADSRRKAIEKCQEALALWRSEKAPDTDHRIENQVAFALNMIGRVYGELGEKRKALDFFTQALPIFKAVNNRRGEAATLDNIGETYIGLSEYQKALDYCNQALLTHQTEGDRHGEGVALNNIGAIHSMLGDSRAALGYYEKSLALLTDAGDHRRVATALDNIGEIHIRLGEYQKALDYCNQALAAYRQAGDRSAQAGTLSNIGGIFDALGDYGRALDYKNQALALQQAAGDRAGQAITLNNIGYIYSRLGQKRKALDFYNQSLALRRGLGNARGEAITLNNIGAIHDDLGETQKALDYYNQSLPIFKAIGDQWAEAVTLNNIGKILEKSGDSQRALDHYNKSSAILRASGYRKDEAQATYNIARVERDRGNLVEARRYVEKALATVESLRTNVVSQQLRASYFATVRRYHEFDVDLLMRLHKQRPSEGFAAAALQASERARARSLLELLAEARAEIRQGVDPALLERERSLRQAVSEKAERQTRLLNTTHTEEQAAAAAEELDALTAEYEQNQALIRQTSPRYAALTQPEPLSLKEIQSEVLDSETLLLEYALGEEKSYLWAVTRGSINSHELPKRAEVDAAARRLYETLTARNRVVPGELPEQRRQRVNQADAEYSKASAALSEMLLRPVASDLGAKRLLVVAEGVLQYVPFAVLPAPLPAAPRVARPGPAKANANRRPTSYFGPPLIVEHEVVSLPSASVLAVLRRETSGRKSADLTVAVLADPVFDAHDPRIGSPKSERATTVEEATLPTDIKRSATEAGLADLVRLRFSRQEADRIERLASDGKSLKALDFAANRTTATSPELSRYAIVHFATHGLINNQRPELSGIVLSLVDEQGRPQNGFLRLYDIYNLKLDADLVVLSACQTALGKEIKGEGLVGLTRGFMYAGAPRVVASLWQIDDRVTAELMGRFYEAMLRQGLRPAAALRAAQVSLWKDRRWRAPHYWAAFSLQGEWK